MDLTGVKPETVHLTVLEVSTVFEPANLLLYRLYVSVMTDYNISLSVHYGKMPMRDYSSMLSPVCPPHKKSNTHKKTHTYK